MKTIENILKAVMLSETKHLGGVGLAVLLSFVTFTGLQADEINFSVGPSNFVADTLANGRSFEAFKFDSLGMPVDARIDIAVMELYIDRPPIDLNDTLISTQFPLALFPITSDWTPSSIKSGQVVTVDREWASHGVADFLTGDRVDFDITYLFVDWLKGTKTNRGLILVGDLGDKTRFTIASNSGVKVQVFIYYTGPEVVKQER